MNHVDALSRAPVEEANDNLIMATNFNISVREDEIMMYLRCDELLERKIKILEKVENTRTRREKGEVVNYILRDGILFKKDPRNTEKELDIVPRAMRKALVIKNHDLSSHFGVDRTIARISEHYYFARMRNYVRRHINACVECLFAKRKHGKQAGELHPIPAGKRPFEIVHIDHLGPIVTSSRKNKYILALNCNLTKFCQFYAVKDTKSSTTVRKVEEFVHRFGAPNRIVTDRGTSFTAENFKHYCESHGIKLTLNSSRHAQANGQIQRLNQTILPALQSSITDTEGRYWDENVRKLERDLNTAVCKTTGRTRFEALYGYVPRFNEGLARELSERSETYCLPEDVREKNK